MKIYLRLLKYLKPYWKQCVGALCCMLLMSLCNVLLIPLVAKLSDGIGSKDFALLNLVILAAIVLYFFRGASIYGQIYLMSFGARRVVTDLRIQVYKHLQDLSLDFYSKWRSGDVISRVIDDIRIIQTALISSVTELFPSIITLIGVFGFLMYLNWRLTSLTIVVMPLLAYTITHLGLQMRIATTTAQAKIADISSQLQETLMGIRVVKSFAMENHEIDKFTQESEKTFWATMKQSQIIATQVPLLGFIQALAVVAIIWYGGYEVVSGRLAPSNLIAFFTGIALLADPLTKLGNINTMVQESLAAAQRVFEVIDIHPTVKEKADAVKLEKINGEVIFKDVSFKYEDEQNAVLKDINIKVNPGEVIAIVGPSGAGKTSFVNLIPRFYDVTSGEILVDGVNVKDIQLFSLRSQTGIVPQETILFSGSIKSNIAYGKIGATDEEIINAAQAANAHQFIQEFTDGYDTFVGERGVKLSGGQRQRVAIARALLRNPKILIFDEATSALDTESERLVQDAMDHLMAGRTTFVIAHRLSTVQHAGRILVVDQGEIVEEGNHQTLIAKGGLYKKLYDMQFRDEIPKQS
ncbi:MAG: ABC transporter ATP-binding protein/permease [Candidatus Margulisbacteria bacterium]|nr:ABC transporter ATP-binding protein/permease [Candidatus Margulisiibacteriota bacterium]MBU1022229.1 ABC transporter ATP-binding protein/permease [Candidatus Margulisiibacteriota bacterium]MBU1729332.1 ABC transporter ATP-binding protein/permease [Candidatus Margulisiibacteriota bacterium]MBU1955605.1 ABC transporter ATP-binding protein/permease [Candidatus Margulisiibacteriota bacterium]